MLGPGGGHGVNMLTYYSNDLSSISAEVYNFCVKLLLKRGRCGPFEKQCILQNEQCDQMPE